MITSLSLLVWKCMKHCEPPKPLSPPHTHTVPPRFIQKGETGLWCSRSTHLSRGCTPPPCSRTRSRRSHPPRRWSHPAWPRPRCCVRRSCCPASSTRCGSGRRPPRSGERGSHRIRQQQTACLQKRVKKLILH